MSTYFHFFQRMFPHGILHCGIVTILFTLGYNCHAQQKSSVKIGVEIHDSWVEVPAHYIVTKVGFKYRIIPSIEPGIELGYAKFTSDQLSDFQANVPFYAIRLNILLLPLFSTAEESKFDPYISGKYGAYYPFFKEPYTNFFPQNMRPDYGAYLGMVYSFSRYIGIYIEGGYGNLSYYQLGLNVKF